MTTIILPPSTQRALFESKQLQKFLTKKQIWCKISDLSINNAENFLRKLPRHPFCLLICMHEGFENQKLYQQNISLLVMVVRTIPFWNLVLFNLTPFLVTIDCTATGVTLTWWSRWNINYIITCSVIRNMGNWKARTLLIY